MIKNTLLLLALLTLLTACTRHAWFEDQAAIKAKITPVKEPANPKDPAAEARAAFARGDRRYARASWDIIGWPANLTSAEALAGSGMKVFHLDGSTLYNHDKEGQYVATYNRTLADLIMGRTPATAAAPR